MLVKVAKRGDETRDSALEKIREVWKKAQAEADKKTTEGTAGIDTGHSTAEKIAQKTNTPKNQIDKDKKLDVEANNLATEVAKNADEETKTRWELERF